MVIVNAKVLINGRFEAVPLTVQNGKIAGFEDDGSERFDAQGQYVLPGMIDTHIHGFFGEEFAKAEGGFEKAQAVLAAQGTTGFAATVRCMPFDDVLAAVRNAASYVGAPTVGAKVLGVHSEGPFVSSVRAGAMYPPEITCDVDAVGAMIEAGNGTLKLMTMAPERENAVAVIPFAEQRGLHITMGHTDATFDQATAAVDAGARRATHVFNAMRPLYHRETGILGAALTDDRVCCEMIADFVHLDPAAVKLVYRTKGAQRITLISDAGMMSGLPNGEYVVGGHTRIVKDGLCLNKAGRIAGSCYSMLKGAQNLRTLGVPLEEIAVIASENPAKALDVFDSVGSIAVGKCADLVVADDAFALKAVFVDGVKQ